MYQTYVHHNIRKEITVTLQSETKNMYTYTVVDIEQRIAFIDLSK